MNEAKKPDAGVTVLSEVVEAPHDDFRGERLNVCNGVRLSPAPAE